MPKYAEFQTFREQNLITEADGDMLHREARALALRRIEESARTEEDFREVINGGINWMLTGNAGKGIMKKDAPLSLWNGAQTNHIFLTGLPMTRF